MAATAKKSKRKTTTPKAPQPSDWTPEAAERIVKNLRTLAMGSFGSLARRTDELLGPIAGRLYWEGYDDPDHLEVYGRGDAVSRTLDDDGLCLASAISEVQKILTEIHLGVARDHHGEHLLRLADELERGFGLGNKKPSSGGRKRKYTDRALERAAKTYEAQYEKTNDARQAWATVADLYDFPSGNAARGAVRRWKSVHN